MSAELKVRVDDGQIRTLVREAVALQIAAVMESEQGDNALQHFIMESLKDAGKRAGYSSNKETVGGIVSKVQSRIREIAHEEAVVWVDAHRDDIAAAVRDMLEKECDDLQSKLDVNVEVSMRFAAKVDTPHKKKPVYQVLDEDEDEDEDYVE